MPTNNRDEFVRQLWLAGFELKEDLPTAHLFIRPDDGARVLVPKQHDTGHWTALAPSPPASSGGFISPCCEADSHVRRVLGGMVYFRCAACTHLWSRPSPARNGLHLVT